jgi:homopolymeric O-antigen transport system permease protein
MRARSWHLILQFALKDFKIRYTHSVLGYAWSVLNPLVFALIYYFVFSVFVRFDVPNYPGFLLIGIVMWNFFSEGSSNGVGSLLARSAILTKVSMPRYVVVCAAILNALLTFGISLGILGGILWFTGTHMTMAAIAFPVLLLDLILLTLGIALFLAPLHVRYHDVGYLWGLAVQVGFWLTPIIYQEMMIPQRWQWLMTYNPMARIILYSRQAVIYGVWPDWAGILKTSLVAMLVLAVGWATFQRQQARLVEHF